MSKNFADSVMEQVMKKAADMVDDMAEQTEDVVNDAMQRYYNSYTPAVYKRTYRMRDSIYRTKAQNTTPLTAEAEVGVLFEDRKYKMSYSLADAIHDADRYTHGGYHVPDAEVSVWDDPIEEVEQKQKEMWKKAATAAGIGR